MAGYNRIIIVGNLTRDPDLKMIGAQAVCKLGIASNRQYKNRQTGEMAQEVCFVDVDVWGAQADTCKSYLQKGRSVLVEGRLKLDTWKDTEGNTRSKHSIIAERVVFLNSSAAATTDTASIPESTSDSMSLSDSLVADTSKEIKIEKTAKSRSRKGTVEFKEEPAFEDDLPF